MEAFILPTPLVQRPRAVRVTSSVSSRGHPVRVARPRMAAAAASAPREGEEELGVVRGARYASDGVSALEFRDEEPEVAEGAKARKGKRFFVKRGAQPAGGFNHPSPVERSFAPPVPQVAKVQATVMASAAQEGEMEKRVKPPKAEGGKVEREVAPPTAEGGKVEREVAPPTVEGGKVEREVAPPTAEEVKVENKLTPPAAEGEKAGNKVTPPSAEVEKVEKGVTPPAAEEVKVEKKATSPAVEKVTADPSDSSSDVAPAGEKSSADPPERASTVKMSSEDVEAAAKKREAAERVAEKQKVADDAKVVSILDNTEKVLTAIGSKTGVFALGARARGSLEAKIDEAASVDLSKVEEGKAIQAKFASGAANAIRKVSSALSGRWDEAIVPKLQEKFEENLPEGQGKRFGTKTITTGVVTFLCGVLLLPLFIGGGGTSEKTSEQKKISEETAALDKKLSTKSMADAGESAKTSTKASDIKSPFPPEPSAPSLSKASTVVTAAAPAPGTVTEATALSGVKTALGSRSSYVVSGYFDTLAPEPTIVVEVTRNFARLSAADKRSFADVALRSARGMGYEAVSIVQTGTESELVHAGIDIDLDDEAANLRAQLRVVQRQVDSLASRNAAAEAEVEAAKERLEEERDQFKADKLQFQNQMKTVRGEVAAINDELREAKTELAELPDRLLLEKRTEAAEKESRKLSDTVEVLGRQLTLARDDEMAAKAAEATSRRLVADTDLRIAEATRAATQNADAVVSQYKEQADASVADARSKLAKLEEASTKAAELASKNYNELKEASERTLADTIRAKDAKIQSIEEASERTLADTIRAKDMEIQSIERSSERILTETVRAKDAQIKSIEKETETNIVAKYETLLNDLKKKYDADLNRLTTDAKTSSKLFDDTQREAEKEKGDLKREKLSLTKKVERLQARLQAAGDRSGGLMIPLARVETDSSGQGVDVTAKYEALLSDLQKRTNAELDRYNADAKQQAKLLDDTRHEAEKQKGELAREKLALVKKVEKLEAKQKTPGMTAEERSVTTLEALSSSQEGDVPAKYEALINDLQKKVTAEKERYEADFKAQAKLLDSTRRQVEREKGDLKREKLALAKKVNVLEAKLEAVVANADVQ